MPRIERNAIIDAPVEKVFAYINDPTRILEWSPGHMAVRDATWLEKGKQKVA